MNVITSKENETIKQIRKLKDKKYRDESKTYIVEGSKMIKEAIDEKVKIKKIVICEECIKDGSIEQKLVYEIAKLDCIYVNEKIFQSISEVKTPQGILAVVEKDNKELNVSSNDEVIIALDGIQDPGNLGTIIRTADSAGIKQIILSPETADPYNSKVVRSTMGAIFRINIVQTQDFIKELKTLQKNKYKVTSTSLEESESIYKINYKKRVIVIGNESNGVSKEVLDISDQKIKIPMIGKTESLNAAVAASVIMYEAVRQKLEK